ncbi:MAG: hypothetical protein WCG40_07040 [Actinomycetes bacterium]
MKKIIVPALTVLTLFAAACGDDSVASAPPILRITGGVSSGSNTSADQALGAPESSTSGKMMWMGQQHFTAVSGLPSLDSDAPSYVISASDVAKRDLNSLRKAFSIKDEFVAQGTNMGGGYLAGDYNTSGSPTIYVSADAMHYWSYQAPSSREMAVGCAVPPVAAGDTVPSVEPCSIPTPPENVPSAAQAEDLFRQMLKDLGLKPKDFIIESYADEWNAGVTGYLTIDGVRTSLWWSASYGADAELVMASGVLAEVKQAADYPRIGTALGIERLNNDQQYGWGGPMARGGVAFDDTVVKSQGAPRALAQGIEPMSEEVVGVPVTTEPEMMTMTVTTEPETLAGTVVTPVNGEANMTAVAPPNGQEMPITEIEIVAVEEELLSLYGADGEIYLVPGYAFLAAQESGYTPRYLVSALPDEFIEQAGTDSVDVPTTDVMEPPVPETITPGSIDPGGPVVDAATGITQEAADTLLAMTEAEATKMAASNGWVVRVGQRDDEMFALTKDYRLDRVTLTIVADEVTKVDVG